jgi:hypothetical protein
MTESLLKWQNQPNQLLSMEDLGNSTKKRTLKEYMGMPYLTYPPVDGSSDRVVCPFSSYGKSR